MKITYALLSDADCVYLINGAFNDSPKEINYPSDSPLYVTLLPLKANLLPYTVKIVGGKVTTNTELCESCELSPVHFVLRFKERHNYVYTAGTAGDFLPGKSLPAKLFAKIKDGDIENARSLMTKELSSSIDDESLLGFFEPYNAVIENKFKDLNGSYYLINSQTKKGEAFYFSLKNGLIDNIEQV